MQSEPAIIKQFKNHLTQTQRGLSSQYQNTRDCQAFYAGDLMAYRDSIQFQDAGGQKKRAMVQFNKVKPYVNAVKGFMAQNRRRAKYTARINGDQAQTLYSDYCNALADYVREEANADHVESQQDGDTLIGGYGANETAMSYGIGESTTDPNGQIIMGRLDPLQTGWDPYARETNLLDARWVFYQKNYALTDALELFEDSKEEDFEESGEGEIGEDSGYKFYARGGRYNKIKEADLDWSDQQAEMVKVYFYQWYEFESFYRADNPIYKLKNPQSVALVSMQLQLLAQEQTDDQKDLFSFDPKAEILTFDDTLKSKIKEMLGDFIEIHEYKRKVFYTAVISKDHIFTKYRSICQQGFTVKFKTGDFDSKNKIWTGMVNSMKEPVMYYNKALTELMFIIGANSKGGVLVEEDAVDDIQLFEQKYAKTDAVIKVKSGALGQGKIKEKKSPYTPTGYEQIVQLSDASISGVNGIDKSFLGSSEDKNETGILQSRRIKQVVSSLGSYFDSITLYQKEHARLMLDFLYIFATNNTGGLFRIIGEDGRAQFLRISEDQLVAQYDVTITEAPQSAEEKRDFATLISGMADKLLSVDPTTGKALYAIALKYLPLENMDQQKILQILTPQGPQIDPAYVQQLQAQLKELMSDVTQSEVKERLSKFALNLARVDEVRAGAMERRAKTGKIIHEAAMEETALNHDMNVQTRVTI